MSKANSGRRSRDGALTHAQSTQVDTFRANAQAIDDAPRVTLNPGVEARYGLCPTSQLIPNPHAVHVHSKRQLDKLQRTIEVTGLLSAVVIDETYTILAGHGRLEAVKRSGGAVIPVVQIFGLSVSKKRTFILADNRIAQDARLDREKLAKQIPGLTLLLEEAGFELTDTGFEVAEFDEIIDDLEDDSVDPDDNFDPAHLTEPTFLQSGDIIELGPHRLGVGDARDPNILNALMMGDCVDAACLDVPYNVRVAGIVGRGRVQHPEFAFASGEMTDAEFVEFLVKSMENAVRVSAPGAVHFVFIDWKHVAHLVEAAKKVYAAYLNLIVWNKTNAGQGGLYRNQHELIGVFRVGDKRHANNVQQGRFGRNRSNVWTYPGVNTFRAGRLDDLALHPTVKPIQLVADALKDVTGRGALVLDTFVGSGTTILAAEKVGRRARAIEIEPRYAQIAVRRWEMLTGRAAVHVQSEMTLDELQKARSKDLQGPPGASSSQSTQGCTDAPTARVAPRIRVRTTPTGG